MDGYSFSFDLFGFVVAWKLGLDFAAALNDSYVYRGQEFKCRSLKVSIIKEDEHVRLPQKTGGHLNKLWKHAILMYYYCILFVLFLKP